VGQVGRKTRERQKFAFFTACGGWTKSNKKQLKRQTIFQKNKIVKTKELTNLEKKEIVGGFYTVANLAASDDIVNENSHWGCICNYSNHSAISNKNTVNGCECRCTL
jgi:hypothetical protein